MESFSDKAGPRALETRRLSFFEDLAAVTGIPLPGSRRDKKPTILEGFMELPRASAGDGSASGTAPSAEKPDPPCLPPA